jgi:hypothetical protein
MQEDETGEWYFCSLQRYGDYYYSSKGRSTYLSRKTATEITSKNYLGIDSLSISIST